MRIAIDAGPLIQPFGGVPRYVTELTLALASRFPDDEIHLMSDCRSLYLDDRLEACLNVIVEPPAAGPLMSRWWSVGLPRELHRRQIDVFHGTDFSVPYLPFVPAVMTVHDLSPWKPAPLRPPGSERVRNRTPRLFSLSRRLITPTEAIRRELSAFFHLPMEKIVAAPLAASARVDVSDAHRAALLRRLGLEPPFIVYVGSGEPRKNLPRLIAAWRRAKEKIPALGLALAGPSAETVSASERNGPVWLTACSDQDAAALLSAAEGLVYPSLYEGFGLPVLEAMRLGAPVIASRDPALMEVAGEAARYVDAMSVGSIAEAIIEVVEQPEERRRLSEAGAARARQFDWTRTAERTREVYEDALG